MQIELAKKKLASPSYFPHDMMFHSSQPTDSEKSLLLTVHWQAERKSNVLALL